MTQLRVLVACEYSGRVREAFRARGHNAYSCDLLPSEDSSPHHLQEDVLGLLERMPDWDLMIAHPPCTYLSVSGIHWNNRGRGWDETYKALDFVRALMAVPFPYCIENPVSLISTHIRPQDQVINPYDFGEDAAKKTCLWLSGLPRLTPTRRVPGRLVFHNGKTVERWSNQTDSGQNRLAPSETRWKDRSRTYPGIAQAMATQWSAYLVAAKAA